jgi:hypothetical protein
MLQKIIIKLLVNHLVIQKADIEKLIRLLGKLECGFQDFCLKKSIQAKDFGKEKLSQELEQHAEQEGKHAKMLWSVVDGINRPQRKREHISHGIIVYNPNYFVYESDTQLPKRQWIHTTGISLKYYFFRKFFNNLKAEDYDLVDALAFMCVGESIGHDVYHALTQCTQGHLQKVLEKISSDEQSHSQYLWDFLVIEIGLLKAYQLYWKWQFRKYLALFYIFYDLEVNNLCL